MQQKVDAVYKQCGGQRQDGWDWDSAEGGGPTVKISVERCGCSYASRMRLDFIWLVATAVAVDTALG